MKKIGFALVVGFGLFAIYAVNTTLSTLLPLLGRDFSLSPFSLGLIISSYGWSYAAFQIPVGILSDRIDPKKMLVVPMVLLALSTITFSIASNLSILILSRILMGIGSSFTFVEGLKVIEYYYEEKSARGLAVGLFFSLGALGTVLPNFVVSILLHLQQSSNAWRLVYSALATLPLAAGALSFIFTPRGLLARGSQNETHGKKSANLAKEALDVVRNARFWIQNVVQFAFFGTYIGLLFWLPSFLQSQGANPLVEGSAVPLYAIGGVFGNALAGWVLSKHVDQMMLLRSSMVLYAVVLFLLIAFPLSLFGFGGSIFSFLSGFTYGGTVASPRLIAEIFDKNKLGTAFGIANTVAWIGSSFYPFMIGYLLSLGYGYFQALIPLVASMALPLALTAFFRNESPSRKK